MSKKGLEIGKTALFKHCDMGLIDVEIEKASPLKPFYTGKLKKVYLKEMRIKESALLAVSLLSQGRDVDVFVQPDDFIRYK